MSFNPTDQEKINFANQIEEIVWDLDVPYMEAILIFCEKNDLEETVAANLLSPPLKSKIEEEAQTLNLIRGKANRLPC